MTPADRDVAAERARQRRRAARRMSMPVAMLVASFLLATALANGALPDGADRLVSVFVELTLPPLSLFVFIIAGVLAPPVPFATGALLGLLDGVLWSALFVISSGETRSIDLADILAIILVAVAVGTVVTGIVGWVANAIVRGRRHSREHEQVFVGWPSPQAATLCPRCGAPSPPTAAFCPTCGAFLRTGDQG